MTPKLIKEMTELLEKIEDQNLHHRDSETHESFTLLDKLICEINDFWDGFREPRYVEKYEQLVS